jgi:single-stranded-DNA-specific exonuclease
MRRRRRWKLAPPAPESILKTLDERSPVVAQVLYNRGLRTRSGALDFYEARFDFDNPYRLKGVAEAVHRLRLAIKRKECVAVYGDFDVDGVTSSVLISKVFESLGIKYQLHIPHRIDEGYGLNKPAIRELRKKGCTLLLTVDCGIRSVDEVAYARKIGMDVILTDHHSVGAEIPPANAVINPKQAGDRYPFKDLAGVGVAYKLAQGVLRAERQIPSCKKRDSIPIDEEDLLDLVALGTVADIVPLRGENRSLVKRGLQRLNDARRPGLQAMIAESGLKAGEIDATAIGFILGPRLNAAGRLETALYSYRILHTEDASEAIELAAKLGKLNRTRQEMTERSAEIAREQIMQGDPDAPIFLVDSPSFHRGIVGLVASRLTEELHRPVLVAKREEVFTYGSARSIPASHITHALDKVSGLLHRYGGHAAAAGFTLRTDNLEKFRSALLEVASDEFDEKAWTPELPIDAKIGFRQITPDVYHEIARMEPFGEGNPQPIFCSGPVEVRSARAVGANGSHLKLFLAQGGVALGGIAFRMGELAEKLPSLVDVAFQITMNNWNGKSRLELMVVDILPAGQGCSDA